MRTFIIGSKELSCIILDTLFGAGHEVLGVFSRDTQVGMRVWHEMGHRSLAEEAEALNIPVYHEMKVNSDAALNLLSSLNLDVVYSCFWSEIFRQPVLDIPRLGVFNFHSALLPSYRGSRPIPWAMINGEARAGMTAHKMLPGIDNGPIAGSVSVEIGSNSSAKEVYDSVVSQCPGLVLSVTSKFSDASFKLTEQDEKNATYYPRGEPFARQLNAWWSEAQQDRFKRAFDFPPFKQAKSAPGPLNVNLGPQVYFVTSDGLPILEISKFKFDLKQNSIGSPRERKEIKNHLPPTTSPGIMLDSSAAGMYMIHDVLIGKGIQFISSAQVSPADIKTGWGCCQPYRHENGLLEIPAIRIKDEGDLNGLVKAAQRQCVQAHLDIFIHIQSTPAGLIGLTGIASNLDVSLIDINSIANHYNESNE
jgi:methionyl-tRNA formyltransferase